MKISVTQLLNQKSSTVVSVPVSATVAEAVRAMNDHRIGSVVVMSDREIAGIFTERDVLTRVVSEGREPRRTPVREVMTTEVLTIEPDAPIEVVMETITRRRCRHLPVVQGGEILGLISIGDILRWLVEAHRAEAEHLRAYIAGDLAL